MRPSIRSVNKAAIPQATTSLTPSHVLRFRLENSTATLIAVVFYIILTAPVREKMPVEEMFAQRRNTPLS